MISEAKMMRRRVRPSRPMPSQGPVRGRKTRKAASPWHGTAA